MTPRDDTLTTYNFHVAELRNYTVGETGILVHNNSNVCKQCAKTRCGVVRGLLARCEKIRRSNKLDDCEEDRTKIITKCCNAIKKVKGTAKAINSVQDKACPKDPECGDCSGFTYLEKPPGGGAWLDRIGAKDITGWTETDLDNRIAEINKDPSRDKDVAPHGHHIAMKGDRFKPENKKAREILCSVGIDPYIGKENLVFSPNWCHSKAYATTVLQSLTLAGASKKKSIVVIALKQLAKMHRICKFPTEGVDVNDINE